MSIQQRVSNWTIAKLTALYIILSVCVVFAADTVKTVGSKPEMDIGKAVIVVGKEAEAPEVFAAEELSKYAEKMSGIKLPIAKDNEAVTNENFIFIGTLKSNDKIRGIVKKEEINIDKLDKDHDGFIIKTIGNKLVLMGSNPRSALYGVYALLEKLGCLWPAEGEDYVPALKNTSVSGVDVTEIADLDYRICFSFSNYLNGADGGFNSVAWLDWLAKNRCNWILFYLLTKQPCNWEGWKKKNISMELEKRGIKVDFGLDGAATYFLPPEKYYQEHPEYYALMNGKRIKHMVCVSNPDVIRLEAENVIEFLKNNPEVGMISLSACDGFDWCECDQCVKLDSPLIKCVRNPKYRSTSNSHIIFQNEVLKRVNKVFPDIKFAPTAYAGYAEPPRIESRDISKNLITMVTLYVRCPSHAICDKDCVHNQSFYAGMESWVKWYGDRKMVFPFDLNSGMCSNRELPLPMLKTTAKDFPYYKGFGGVVIWVHGSVPLAGFNYNLPYALNQYVAMRLAWNVNESLDKILSGYFGKYYGNAGEFMRDYYMVWEDVAHKNGGHCPHSALPFLSYVTGSDLKKCEDSLAMAEKVSESKDITDRIMKMRYYFDYVKAAHAAGSKLNSLLRSAKEEKVDQARREREELFGLCGKLLEFVPGDSESPGKNLTSTILAQVLALSVNEANTNFVNFVFNGGFEYGRIGWFGWSGRTGQQRGVIDTNEFHGGGQSVRFDNSNTNETCQIYWRIKDGEGVCFSKAPKPIKISGWSRARDVVKGKGRYCISVDFLYEDGTSSGAHQMAFNSGTHDWQYGEKVFTPDKSVKSANVYVRFDLAGTVWFDDICLAEINPAK